MKIHFKVLMERSPEYGARKENGKTELNALKNIAVPFATF